MRLLRRQGSERQVAAQSRPKSYLYVSDEKVAMLTEGLDPTLRDQFDLKVGVGVGVAKVELAPRQKDLGRYERAERLCKALDAQGNIGDVYQNDREFIRGTMMAVWGFWSRQIDGYADVVFFTALADDTTLVGLGGSAYHTMTRSEDRLQRWSNSGVAVLLEFLKEQSEPTGKHHSHLSSPWYHEMGVADSDNETAAEEIEFVAQRLLVHDEEEYLGFRAILGSPIYVARTGRPSTNRMRRQYLERRRLFWETHDMRGRPGGLSRILNSNRWHDSRIPPEFDPQLPPAAAE